MYLFIDFETTGLDTEFDEPIEAAWQLTTNNFAPISNGYWLNTLNTTRVEEKAKLSGAYAMHAENGLWADVRQARIEGTVSGHAGLERTLVSHIDQAQRHNNEAVLVAGFHPSFDAAVLKKWFPEVDVRLDYHTFDVRTIESLFDSAKLDTVKAAESMMAAGRRHRAQYDMELSLQAAKVAFQLLAGARW